MTKKEEKEFNLIEELKQVQLPEHVKNGVLSYISRNNLQVKNRKELDKHIEDYGKIGSGGA